MGEPQVWPVSKLRKVLEPMLVLFTKENTIRFQVPISDMLERRKRFCHA